MTNNTNCFSSAVGGSGFVGANASTFNFQLNTLYNTISNIADSITDVIFAGGYNDNAQNATLATAISTAISNAKSKFQNAKIWVISIGYSIADTNTVRDNLITTDSIYCEQATSNGAAYIPASKILKMSANWMSADSIHPTQAGYKELAANIASIVQGGNMRNGYLTQVVTLAPLGNITIPAAAERSIMMQAVNDTICVFDNRLALDRFIFPAGALNNEPNWTNLATLENTLIHGTSNKTYCQCTGFLKRGNGTTYSEWQGFLRFDSNKMGILIRNITNGSYDDLSNVTSLTIDFFGIKLPIDVC